MYNLLDYFLFMVLTGIQLQGNCWQIDVNLTIVFPQNSYTLQVFQKRFNGSISFFRGWNDYKFGFGKADGEYWLGKYERIKKISSSSSPSFLSPFPPPLWGASAKSPWFFPPFPSLASLQSHNFMHLLIQTSPFARNVWNVKCLGFSPKQLKPGPENYIMKCNCSVYYESRPASSAKNCLAFLSGQHFFVKRMGVIPKG